jgi:hypothetical protein
MKVITSIYLNCRPDLRDEWLTGTEVDDVTDAQVNSKDSDPTGRLIVTLGSGASFEALGQVLSVLYHHRPHLPLLI